MTVAIDRKSRTEAPLDITTGLVLVVLGLCASAVVLAFPSALDGRTGSLWASVCGAVSVGCGSFVLARHRISVLGSPRWLRIGPLFSLYYALVFGVFSLGWLAPQSTGNAALVNPSQVPSAVALATIGLACWVVGYLLGAPAGVSRLGRSLATRMFRGSDWAFRFPSVPIGVYLVGVAAQLEQLRTSQFGYLQSGAALSSPSALGEVTSLLADFMQFGLILAALDAFAVSRSFRSRVVLVVLLIGEIAAGLFAGSKQDVIVAVVSVGIVAVYSKGHLSMRAVVAGVVVILVVFPSTGTYRASIRNSAAQSVAPGQAAGSLVQTLETTISGLTPRGLFIDSPAAVASRLREIDNVTIIDQKTPSEIPYQPWTDLIAEPAIDWVPRLVWPSKPVLSTGQDFSEEYYDTPVTVLTASAVTVPGDLLLHGGVVPLGLGMLLLGILMYTMDLAVDPARDQRRLLLFIPLLTTMIYSENDTTTLLLGIVGIFVAVAVAGWLAFVPRH